jgi:hypothetical protein
MLYSWITLYLSFGQQFNGLILTISELALHKKTSNIYLFFVPIHKVLLFRTKNLKIDYNPFLQFDFFIVINTVWEKISIRLSSYLLFLNILPKYTGLSLHRFESNSSVIPRGLFPCAKTLGVVIGKNYRDAWHCTRLQHWKSTSFLPSSIFNFSLIIN